MPGEELLGSQDMIAATLTAAATGGGIECLYLAWRAMKAEQLPPLAYWFRTFLGGASEWGGAAFLTLLMLEKGSELPPELQAFGYAMTTLIWIEAILPRLAGER